MKLIACIKEVPDTATQIKINPGGTEIIKEGVEFIVNPYDEYAVEECLRIKEKFGEGEVIAVCMGPARATEAIRKCLAMGVDRAVHLSDPAFEKSDTYATAKALAKTIEKVGFDLILCGKQAVDGDGCQVGAQLAELLGIPDIPLIVKLEISQDKKTAIAYRQVEGATEVVEVKLPALFTCQKGLNEARYPSLKGIMGAKKKEIKVFTPADLGEDPSSFGEAGSLAKMVKISLPSTRQSGRKFEGEPADISKELVKSLMEQDKVL